MKHLKGWGYWTAHGLYTLVKSGDVLSHRKITDKDAAIVRSCHGFVFDREGFAESAASEWSSRQHEGAFTPIGKMRIFVLPEKRK